MRKTILGLCIATGIGGASALSADCGCCEASCGQTVCCYPPPFYNSPCCPEVVLDVEFFVWYARETNLGYASQFAVIDSGFVTTTMVPSTLHFLKTSWDPGFRLGVGFTDFCDGWDLFFTWTYFQNTREDDVQINPPFANTTTTFPIVGEGGLLNPWVNSAYPALGDDFSTAPFIFNQIKAKWKLDLNIADLELGKRYWLSPCFNLRPFTGIRGAWANTKFLTLSTRTTSGTDEINATFKDRFTNKVWGVGLLAGLAPTWELCRCFSLFGNLTGSIIWGQFKEEKEEEYFVVQDQVITVNVDNTFESRFSGATPILDLALGIRWESVWCNEQFSTALDLAWEHHVWFDQNHRQQYIAPFNQEGSQSIPSLTGYSHVEEANGTLGFGGPLLRLKFGF